MKTALRQLVILPIRVYRLIISPLIPNRCRYSPSCSDYSIQAIQRHGILKGLILGAARIGRCHAMFTGGDDGVPEHFSFSGIREDYRRYRDRS